MFPFRTAAASQELKTSSEMSDELSPTNTKWVDGFAEVLASHGQAGRGLCGSDDLDRRLERDGDWVRGDCSRPPVQCQ